jgi:hypothetical protein
MKRAILLEGDDIQSLALLVTAFWHGGSGPRISNCCHRPAGRSFQTLPQIG